MTAVETKDAGTYEVLAVRYATRRTVASEVYLNYHHYGQPDVAVEMDYFFWVLRNGSRTVVVDTGFTPEVGDRRGRTTICSPADGLSRLDIEPGTVDQVVITHGHYDHTGNLGLFTDSEILVSRREVEFWTGPYAGRALFGSFAEQADIEELAGAARSGRATLITGQHDAAPGIELIEVGGHTPGQLVVQVATATGPAVLTSDAMHYYDELELDRPFAVLADLAAMYQGFDRIAELTSTPGAMLVAGHDPEVRRRFPPLSADDPGFAVRVA